MFSLQEKVVQFLHMNTRDEKHGDEDVTAHDLKFRFDMTNAELSMFSDRLLDALYMPEDDGPDLLGDAPLTRLRLGTGVEEIHWTSGELVGATVILHYGVDTELRFGGAKVNGYRLEPKEGGTVSVTFRAQINPDRDKIAHESGLLTEMRSRGVATITVEPPAAKAEGDPDLVEQAGQQSESRKDAEGLFGGGEEGDGDPPAPAATGRRRAAANVE